MGPPSSDAASHGARVSPSVATAPFGGTEQLTIAPTKPKIPATTGPAKKVLILSASAGAGHVRAADALLKVCQLHPRIGQVQHWDMLKYTSRFFRHMYHQVYLDLINKAPKMLGWLYDAFDTPWRREKMRLAFDKFNAGPFLKAAAAFQPDLIICTHFTPAALMAWLYENGRWPVKPAIAVTDFDCHAMWLVRSYQHYFVALEETRIHMARLGIDAAAITVSGIPVDPAFQEPKTAAAARRRLGLDSELFTILVMAGGYGVGPVETLIEELYRLRRPAQLVVVAGQGEALKLKLDQIVDRHNGQRPVRMVPVGYTTLMDEYMAAADLLISKPGGLTISEALARQLPLCIVNPIPGQEERNSDHLLEAGVAIRCNNVPALAWKLERLMDEPQRLSAMRQNTLALAHPDAAQRIVEVLAALPAPPAFTAPKSALRRRLQLVRRPG
jgi:processive 1,2-diacylglycerol beta-glucosyltransferase